MMIENLDEIKSKLDPRDVLGFIGYSKSKPTTSGKEIRDYCPVHEGSDQKSLAVNCETGDWHCHSCGESGDIIGLYSKAKNASFLDAVTKLTERFQIPIRMKGDKPSFVLTPREAFDAAAPIGKHEYLSRKCVEICHGIRFGNDAKGNYSIVVPFYNALGELQTVQYVHGRGKFFLKGYTPKGAFFPIGEWKDGDTLYLAEGLATALTIWMAFDKKVPVVSFGSAGNLSSVVASLCSTSPRLKIVVCLDRNEAAFSQALKMDSASCEYRLPSFEGLSFPESSEPADFNDLISVCSQSLSLVHGQLDKPISRDEIRGLLDFMRKQKAEPSKQETEIPKETASSSSDNLSGDVELDVLKYALSYSFEDLIDKGFNPEEFSPSLFNGNSIKDGKDWTSVNRLLGLAIRGCWESEIEPTPAEVALRCGKHSDVCFELLKRIQDRPCISATQLLQRIDWLRQNNATASLKRELVEAEKSSMPIHEMAKNLRRIIDGVQGQSESVLSQSVHLHKYVDEIKNPANKPILTGIKSFDRLIGGGFKKTEVGCLAGGAGAGKTAFALQVADSLAEKGAYVIYVSVEIGARKLTERSLKRLSYGIAYASADERIDKAVAKYEKIAGNIAIIKGYSGMTVSEIRGKALSVKRRIGKQDLVLMIDPFQRLGTGNPVIDCNNETLKVNQLISEIKQMAEDLEIPILVLSDTVKGHKDNTSGEGVGRGSYMIDHTADYTIMIRTNSDALKALYGDTGSQKPDDPFYETIKAKLEHKTFKDKKFEGWDKYASLVTPKVRDSGKFNPLFIYRPAHHLFEDLEIWEGLLPKEKDWF